MNADEQYRLLIDLRRAESTRFWAIFSVMTAINGGLLSVSRVDLGNLRAIPICLFGLVVCFAWTSIQKRCRFWVTRWQDQLKDLEEKTSIFPQDDRVFSVKQLRGDKKYARSPGCWSTDGSSIKDCAVRMAVFFMVFWFAATIGAIGWQILKAVIQP